MGLQQRWEEATSLCVQESWLDTRALPGPDWLLVGRKITAER